jgi:four helix bundle protein
VKYKHFEELPCWQKARELSRAVSDLINSSGISSDFSLRNQIWKASGSVMDNIAEGFDDGSSAEFVRFLGYAQRSCGEVQSQLYRALDCSHIDKNQFDKIYELGSETRKQIKGFRKYLRTYKSKTSKKGLK